MTEKQFLNAYDELADAIWRYCFLRSRDRELAKDLTQETFFRAWRYLTSGREINNIRPFLYQTARHLLIDAGRKPRPQSLENLATEGLEPMDERQDAAARLAQVSGQEVLRLAKRLPAPYYEVVLLRYVENLTPKEIAAVIDESENVVSVRLHRAHDKLKTMLNNQEK